MRKAAVYLTDPTWDNLGRLVKTHGANASVVVEAALQRFLDCPPTERAPLIRRLHAQRKATTREAWMRFFWEGLAAEFGTSDFDTTGQHLMAERTYCGFGVVYLLRAPDRDDGQICLEVRESPPYVGGVEHLVTRFEPGLEDSPYGMASQVAVWINAQQPRAQVLREQRKAIVASAS